MSFITLLLAFFIALNTMAAPQKIDGLYVNTFGEKTDPSIIFIHGGPGFNSHDFEVSTAEALANEGFFVVVYDQLGQGRSDEASAADFNYKKYSDDLLKLIQKFDLSSPTLLGHSHGGPIAINFDQHHPNVAKSIILVSAPINFWGSVRSIFENCSRNYTTQNNAAALGHLSFLYYELMVNPKSEQSQQFLVGSAFGHGMQCGLYKTSVVSAQAKELYTKIQMNPIQQSLTGLQSAMPGFLANENYIRGNYVNHVFSQKGRYFGIYGNEDGLFTPLELSLLQNTLDTISEQERIQRFEAVKGASHSIFIDQQSEFIRLVKKFTR